MGNVNRSKQRRWKNYGVKVQPRKDNCRRGSWRVPRSKLSKNKNKSTQWKRKKENVDVRAKKELYKRKKSPCIDCKEKRKWPIKQQCKRYWPRRGATLYPVPGLSPLRPMPYANATRAIC